MLGDIEAIVSDLQSLMTELERLLTRSTGDVASHAEEALATWRSTLQKAQDRLNQLLGQTHRKIENVGNSAEQAVHGNPWRSVAIAAAAGFLFGLALSTHRESRP